VKLEVRQLALHVGAEVRGIDPSKPLADETIAGIRAAWVKHGVLVFPGMDMSLAQQVAFSRQFGELELHPIPAARHPQYPEIMVVTNKASEDGKPSTTAETGRQWHSDGAFTLKPSLGSFLHCREIPGVGGDTWFTSMYAAFDALSPPMQRLAESLEVVNSLAKQTRTVDRRQDVLKEVPPVIQPMVRVHSETGRKALYLNDTVTTGIAGLSADESDALLRFFFAHSVKPEFTYRHRWRPLDLVFWDNRSTMHLAPKDYAPGEPRYMCRTTLVGEASGRPAFA
jgi:taurine dioxygenase